MNLLAINRTENYYSLPAIGHVRTRSNYYEYNSTRSLALPQAFLVVSTARLSLLHTYSFTQWRDSRTPPHKLTGDDYEEACVDT